MGNMPLILLVSWLAGLAAFVGGAVACIEGSADTETKREVTHGIIAFGGGHRVGSRAALTALLGASLLGPLAAGIGYLFLQDAASLTAGIMTFASGGFLYLIFQDIAPQARLRKHWVPALGAVLGFCVGLLGKKLIG